MICNCFKGLVTICLLATFLFITSCQKGVNEILTEPIPDEVKDSTLLIKSIKTIWDKGTPDEDSVVEHYWYDTANRKLTITWNDENEDYVADGTKLELSYNAKGLLTHASYIYPAGYVPWEFDYQTIELSYDAANVLQNITAHYSGGSIESITYSKTMLSNGKYQLTWSEGMSPDNDSTFRRVEFDKEGNALINYVYNYQYPSMSNSEHTLIVADSLIYDAGGSVSKILRRVNYDDTTNKEYTFYEYTRQSKGDQLYNQRRVIMSGIDNIPFGDFDNIVTAAFGPLSFVLDYENVQYSRYPIQTAKARMWDGSFENFTANSEFDNKDRLIKFTGFFHDIGLEPTEYRISYYK